MIINLPNNPIDFIQSPHQTSVSNDFLTFVKALDYCRLHIKGNQVNLQVKPFLVKFASTVERTSWDSRDKSAVFHFGKLNQMEIQIPASVILMLTSLSTTSLFSSWWLIKRFFMPNWTYHIETLTANSVSVSTQAVPTWRKRLIRYLILNGMHLLKLAKIQYKWFFKRLWIERISFDLSFYGQNYFFRSYEISVHVEDFTKIFIWNFRTQRDHSI